MRLCSVAEMSARACALLAADTVLDSPAGLTTSSIEYTDDEKDEVATDPKLLEWVLS